MSKIQGKPFVELVIDTLGDKKKDLLELVNGSDQTPEFRSLVNASHLITGSDKNKVQFVVLETWNKTYTGYLVYNNSYCVLFAFHNNTQDMEIVSIDLSKQSYKLIKQPLSIVEFRMYLMEANDHIEPGEIDSGEAAANALLVADGEGGADFVSPEEGSAQYLLGLDSEGNIIKDELPEGIVVDQTIVEDSENAVAGGAVYDALATKANASETYTKTQVDETLEQKANVDGNYPTLTSGLADNLNTKIVQNEKEVYLFRTTGGSLEVGNNCKEKGIVGGSLGFNQLLLNPNFSTNTNWSIGTGVTSLTIDNNKATVVVDGSMQYPQIIQGSRVFEKNHKLLFSMEIENIDNYFTSFAIGNGQIGYISGSVTGKGIVAGIKDSGDNVGNSITIYAYKAVIEANKSFTVTNAQVIDLTAMFGSTIADYIYSLEQGEAGAGVAWFKRYFNKPYYPYTAIGAFINVKTSGKKIVGFNQWDEEWELGTIGWNNGQKQNDSTRIRSKNYIKVLPNTSYYFKTNAVQFTLCWYDANYNYITTDYPNDSAKTSPANAAYCMISPYAAYGTTYNNDICVNFHYDGERDGEYEPYETETYANDDIELIGIPKIDAQGNLYYEGNEYNADGTVVKKYGIVDLGSLSYTYDSTNGYFYAVIDGMKNNSYTSDAIISPLYKTAGVGIADMPDMSLRYAAYSHAVLIKNSSYDNATTFKTAMDGIYLVYELDTPTEDSATPYPENQPCNNWGTEERIDTRSIPIPVGHDTDYPADLKSKLEILPDLPSNDGVYACKVASGTGEYISLGSWLSTNGYVKLTDISGYDAEKTQVLKNVEGTLTWVDEA